MLTLQQLCAMFLVHYGVNLWTLNNEFMSAYDVAAASNHASLARFLDTAASQAFVDDWPGMMKLCRRAAKNARRRLKAQRQSVASVGLCVDYRQHNTSESVDDWRTKTLPDEVSSSSVTSRPARSLVFVQSPRLANGRLFPAAATDSDALSHSKSNDRRTQRRFWPISTRHMERHVTERDEPSRVAAAARQLLLMSVDDNMLLHEAQSRVAREQLRLSSLADTTTDDGNNHASGLTPRCGIDSEFFCRARTSDETSAVRLSDVVTDRTHASVKLSQTAWSSAVTHKNPASQRHRQMADVSVANETAIDKTSTCSDVYTVPLDCIQQRSVMAGRPSSQSAGFTLQDSVNVRSDDDPLRRWLANNGLDEYWSMLAMERVDVDTVTLLRDEDLRQLGIPLGPRRRLQRAVGQLEAQSEQSPALITATNRAFSDTTFL